MTLHKHVFIPNVPVVLRKNLVGFLTSPYFLEIFYVILCAH